MCVRLKTELSPSKCASLLCHLCNCTVFRQPTHWLCIVRNIFMIHRTSIPSYPTLCHLPHPTLYQLTPFHYITLSHPMVYYAVVGLIVLRSYGVRGTRVCVPLQATQGTRGARASERKYHRARGTARSGVRPHPSPPSQLADIWTHTHPTHSRHYRRSTGATSGTSYNPTISMISPSHPAHHCHHRHHRHAIITLTTTTTYLVRTPW